MKHQNTMHLNISIVQVCNSERPPSLSGGSRRTCFTCPSPKCNDCFKPNIYNVTQCYVLHSSVTHSHTLFHNVTKCYTLVSLLHIVTQCYKMLHIGVSHQSVTTASNPISNSPTKTLKNPSL